MVTMALEKDELTQIAEKRACGNSKIDFVPDVYDEDGYVEVPSEIKQLCGFCPVREICLNWAVTNNEYGFWAGTSRYQRLQLTQEKARAKCPGCFSDAVMASGRGEVCLACGISWLV